MTSCRYLPDLHPSFKPRSTSNLNLILTILTTFFSLPPPIPIHHNGIISFLFLPFRLNISFNNRLLPLTSSTPQLNMKENSTNSNVLCNHQIPTLWMSSVPVGSIYIVL